MDTNEEIEQALQFWSDRYKELYGARPRSGYQWFRSLTEAERLDEIAQVSGNDV